MEESHLAKVIDPAGGCYFLESLTDELAEKGWAELQKIEAEGGMADALTRGWVGGQIDSAFKGRLANIAKRKDPVTGVSEFPNLAEKPVAKRVPDFDAVKSAAAQRNAEAPSDVSVRGTPGSGEVMASLVEAAKGKATVGGMCRALWRGEETTITPLHPHPYAQPFEELRDASDTHLAMTGQRPRVFLANMGPMAHFTVRAGYAQNFFEAGGFEIVTNKGFRDAESAAEAFSESGANIAVICSSDKLYAEFVPRVAPALHAAGARSVVLAGHPGEQESTYREAGVDRFIYMKCDVLTTLRELLEEEGVLEATENAGPIL